MPTQEQLIQWLPGVTMVAVAAFPGLYYLRQSLLVRLAVAVATVGAVLLLFGAVLGHQFHFTEAEDMPVLVLVFSFGWFVSACARAFRAALSRPARAKVSDNAA